MRCPKCGRDASDGAVICPSCEYILDTSFLGDDILDEPSGNTSADAAKDASASKRKKNKKSKPKKKSEKTGKKKERAKKDVAAKEDPRSRPPRDVDSVDMVAAADGFDDGGVSISVAEKTQLSPFGGDALILGDIDDDYGEAFEERTGTFMNASRDDRSVIEGPTPVYVSASAAALVSADAVLGVLSEVDLTALALTPFEQHVVSFIDGERTFSGLAKETGLSLDDLKIAITMLADKKAIGLLKREDVELAAAASNPALATQGLADPTGKVPSLASADSLDEEAGEAAHDLPPIPGGDVPLIPGGNPAPPPIPGGNVPAIPGGNPAPAVVAAEDIGLEPLPEPAAKAADKPKPKPKSKPKPKKLRVPPAAREKAKLIYEKALADINEGRMARAKQFAQLAAKLDPSEPKYKELVDNWQEAEEVAQESDSAPPDLRLFREAGIAEKKKEYREAVRLLREAIKHNEENGALHNRLGVILATRLKDFSGAMSALFRAVELEPDNPSFRNNLGKVLARAEGKSAANIDIDELITGQSEFSRERALKVGKRKNPWAAFGKKRW